jgi:hypothetical protein
MIAMRVADMRLRNAVSSGCQAAAPALATRHPPGDRRARRGTRVWLVHFSLGGRAHDVRHEALCLYPRFSREELGRRFLGWMTYLNPKGEGDKSMSENQ